MLGTIATAIAGNVASQMLGGGGGGGGGGATVIQQPPKVNLTRFMRSTGRRGSSARKTTPAKAVSPSVYGGGASRYNAILKAMLRETPKMKTAKAAKA